MLRDAAGRVEAEFPGTMISVRNASPVSKHARRSGSTSREPSNTPQQAHERLGRQAKLTIIRGGTDGSQLTERGLPTPNLSTGQHNPHSPLEWAWLDEMVQATEVLVELVKVWAEESASPNDERLPARARCPPGPGHQRLSTPELAGSLSGDCRYQSALGRFSRVTVLFVQVTYARCREEAMARKLNHSASCVSEVETETF